MFYTNIKTLKLPRLPSTALFLSIIKDVIPPPKLTICIVHSVLVAESENIVCSRGLKEYVKMHVLI